MANPHDYSSLFHYSPFPMWVYEIETLKIIDVNHSATKHYGYSREEFLSMTTKDLRPEEEIPLMLKANDRIANKEENIHLGTFTHLKKNGERIRLDINGHKMVFGDKNCMMAVCQDITESEQRMLELEQSERRLQTASKIAKLGYWRFDIINNMLTWSDEVYAIWERDPKTFKVTFETFFNSIHPDDREHFHRAQDAAIENETPLDFNHRIQLPDGRLKWVREMGRLNRDAAGIPISFEGTVQDITKQKEEEQHLKLLESVVTHTGDAIVITEAEPQEEPGPRILYVNKAFTEMTGYAPEDVIGKSPRFLQGPKTDKKALQQLKNALKKWQPYEVTVINYKKNGEPFWVNFSVSPVANEKGWYTHWISIERDVTAAKNEQLQQELLAKISKSFGGKQSLKNSLVHICELISVYADFSLCEVWLPLSHTGTLRLSATYAHHPAAEAFYQHSHKIREIAFGEGLPGTVWDTKQVEVWENIDQKKEFIRANAALETGLKSVLGIPLFYADEIVGVLVVGTVQEDMQLNPYYSILSILETYLGSEINRKRLEEDLTYLFEALPDIICVLDFEGRFVKINAAGCEILEYDESDLLNTSY